jgi:crossover junction endodeoxyribonuclease RuvC
MRILGLDPGLRLTGYGVVDYHPLRPRLVDGGVIRLRERAPMPQRLVELEADLVSLFEQHKPQVCAVEQLYAHYAHPRTAILMGHARGVILLVAQRFDVRIEQFGANRIKQATTGHGHASKEQMQRAVQGMFSLPTLPEPPDVADAIAIALCAGRFIDLRPELADVKGGRKENRESTKPRSGSEPEAADDAVDEFEQEG